MEPLRRIRTWLDADATLADLFLKTGRGSLRLISHTNLSRTEGTEQYDHAQQLRSYDDCEDSTVVEHSLPETADPDEGDRFFHSKSSRLDMTVSTRSH
jgi:hypothetical protein